MSPSDTAIRPRQRLWLPVRGCPLKTPNRVSQVPAGSFCARCLLSPRGVWTVPTVVASHSSAGFTLFGRLATPNMCNEAEPSSRDATARAFASPSLSEQGRPHSLRVRLHDSRPIIMTNSSQLTRTTKLAWRFPNFTNSPRIRENSCNSCQSFFASVFISVHPWFSNYPPHHSITPSRPFREPSESQSSCHQFSCRHSHLGQSPSPGSHPPPGRSRPGARLVMHLQTLSENFSLISAPLTLLNLNPLFPATMLGQIGVSGHSN